MMHLGTRTYSYGIMDTHDALLRPHGASSITSTHDGEIANLIARQHGTSWEKMGNVIGNMMAILNNFYDKFIEKICLKAP